MKHLTKLTASAVTAMSIATGAMAQDSAQKTETDIFQNVAESCVSVNNAVINNQETDLEQAIACAEAIGNYTAYADQKIVSYIDDMPYSYTKGTYEGIRIHCLSAFETFKLTGHKNIDENPSLEDRRVRASHINELSYACLAFSHGNINSEIAENTGTVVLPKENVQTVVDTAYCVAKALGETAYNDGSYDNEGACKDRKPTFNLN